MKFKKLTIFLLLAVLTLTFTACGNSQPLYEIGKKSFWLDKGQETDVGSVDETCIYDIKFSPSENSALKGEIAGSLTTELKDASTLVNGKNTRCYMFKTTLRTKGYYAIEDDRYEVDDSIQSTLYFYGTGKNLYPIHCKKEVFSTTPNDSRGYLCIEKYHYDYVIDYDCDAKTAVVTTKDLTKSEKPEQANSVNADENGENENNTDENSMKKPDLIPLLIEVSDKKIEKLNGNFFDNESLIFIPRSSELSAGYNMQIKTLDAISQNVNTLQLSVDQNSPTKPITLNYSVTKNGKKEEFSNKDIPTFCLKMSLTGKFPGKPIELCYASNDEDKQMLIYIKTELPLDLGSFEYKLHSVLIQK